MYKYNSVYQYMCNFHLPLWRRWALSRVRHHSWSWSPSWQGTAHASKGRFPSTPSRTSYTRDTACWSCVCLVDSCQPRKLVGCWSHMVNRSSEDTAQDHLLTGRGMQSTHKEACHHHLPPLHHQLDGLDGNQNFVHHGWNDLVHPHHLHG